MASARMSTWRHRAHVRRASPATFARHNCARLTARGMVAATHWTARAIATMGSGVLIAPKCSVPTTAHSPTACVMSRLASAPARQGTRLAWTATAPMNSVNMHKHVCRANPLSHARTLTHSRTHAHTHTHTHATPHARTYTWTHPDGLFAGTRAWTARTNRRNCTMSHGASCLRCL